MQNFQTSTDFCSTAKSLDYRRLGKQRLETADCLAIRLGQPSWMSDKQYALILKRYGNHPAQKMWAGYEYSLIEYGIEICREWCNRGYNGNYESKIAEYYLMLKDWNIIKPHWLTDGFCSIHRSILLGKVKETIQKADSESKLRTAYRLHDWYIQQGWFETPAQRIDGRWPYIWEV